MLARYYVSLGTVSPLRARPISSAHMAPLVDRDFDPSFVRRGTKYDEYFFESGK